MINNDNSSKHYDGRYFQWQGEKIGRFGGRANLIKFEKTIQETDKVIDFGCGGGFLLANLNVKKKLGIEINQSAHEVIIKNGVTPYSSVDDLIAENGEKCADVIISDNALEHTLHPLWELKSLLPLLKEGGKIHFIVPCDNISLDWKKNDINYHLYSWSPMNLGNLFTEAGFEVLAVNAYIHKWPPYYETIQKIFGWTIFNALCRFWGRLERSWFQVEVIATTKKLKEC